MTDVLSTAVVLLLHTGADHPIRDATRQRAVQAFVLAKTGLESVVVTSQS